MDIFNLLNMIGGLSLFLYGMSIMGNGLSKMAGGKLETILEKLTTKKIFAVLLGAGVTAVIHCQFGLHCFGTPAGIPFILY